MEAYDRDDDYICDLDSDDCRAESSEDEIEQFLHGTPEQKRKIRRRSLGHESSSEDEFEKEMNDELNKEIKQMSAHVAAVSSAAKQEKADPKAETSHYDEIYFDSDEENKEDREVKSNDDLLYDPEDDDANQRWVDARRRTYQPRPEQPGVTSRGKKPLPSSDAVLDCPACMTTLCFDCQRHELYKNQYRAMFVQNCQVDNTEILKYKKNTQNISKKARKRRRERVHRETLETRDADADVTAAPVNSAVAMETGSTSAGDDEVDLYHPVKCTVCTTEVGVIDADEIFHFFNVLASYS